MYRHTNTRAHMYIYVHTFVHSYLCTQIHIDIRSQIQSCIRTHILLSTNSCCNKLRLTILSKDLFVNYLPAVNYLPKQ